MGDNYIDHPYEMVQAMEGRLVHHAMEWMTRRYTETSKHVSVDELRSQLEKQFREWCQFKDKGANVSSVPFSTLPLLCDAWIWENLTMAVVDMTSPGHGEMRSNEVFGNDSSKEDFVLPVSA